MAQETLLGFFYIAWSVPASPLGGSPRTIGPIGVTAPSSGRKLVAAAMFPAPEVNGIFVFFTVGYSLRTSGLTHGYSWLDPFGVRLQAPGLWRTHIPLRIGAVDRRGPVRRRRKRAGVRLCAEGAFLRLDPLVPPLRPGSSLKIPTGYFFNARPSPKACACLAARRVPTDHRTIWRPRSVLRHFFFCCHHVSCAGGKGIFVFFTVGYSLRTSGLTHGYSWLDPFGVRLHAPGLWRTQIPIRIGAVDRRGLVRRRRKRASVRPCAVGALPRLDLLVPPLRPGSSLKIPTGYFFDARP
ncbi:hypothetical protein J0A67_17320 [Algoriphagus aestuariicola]|uniref:Uncharacterized protein n=1 Tax=Algoriphagus aestuariicola TaxID=1852016 RepID=A0ABS3BUA1_9BACT|nr:hypothetical protein [Algoriphagus aestuariicola]MBN7802640.1 hypothetical protein [Algoriphagus aestuariicola]